MLTLGFKELMRTVPFLTKRGLLEDIDSLPWWTVFLENYFLSFLLLAYVEPGARFCGELLIRVWNQEK